MKIHQTCIHGKLALAPDLHLNPSPYKPLRSQSWDPVRKLSNHNCPILVIGDLNDILSSSEVLGGKPYEYNDGEPAHDIINTQGFIDLDYKGYPYTWSNKITAPDNIQKRLDRALVNSEWLFLFPEAVLSHKVAIGSDHCPLLLNSQPPPHSSPVPFKFQSMWINHQDYKSVVNNS
ncbi:hypothetical protein IFM89_018920 [Coptis chinensis]|uniref:Endonuclease/exonuclease/phosphatase domain-containing protein n=1 Tax=Coptis chinensis TaxID=261450 RepID=A0A835LN28_9MAGN|nr:hypothetical protein IFM89_018920 [Coptis chinensis]